MRTKPRQAGPRRLWPKVDYYEMLEPANEQSHPVERILDEDPAARRTYRRIRRLQGRITVAKGSEKAFRDLQDARVLHLGQEGRLAFNLGVELGVVSGRQDALSRMAAAPARGAGALGRSAQTLIGDRSVDPAEILVGLIEMAWALAAGPTVIRPIGGRPSAARERASRARREERRRR